MNNINNIITEITDALALQSSEPLKEKIKKIRNVIEQYQNDVQNFINQVRIISTIREHIQKITKTIQENNRRNTEDKIKKDYFKSKDFSQIFSLKRELNKNAKEIEKRERQEKALIDEGLKKLKEQQRIFLARRAIIEQLLKKGYVLLDKIRQFFTGEKIIYKIGIMQKGILQQIEVSLETLLKYTYVDLETRQTKIENIFKLRLRSMTDQLKDSQLINQVSPELFTRVQTQLKGIKGNRGNLYETYKLIEHLELNQNQLTKETITSLMEQVRANNEASIKGGDVLNEQIKFFDKSSPSLITASLINSTLNELLQIFNMPSQSNMKDALNKMFIKSNSNNKIIEGLEEEARNKAKEHLNILFS